MDMKSSLLLSLLFVTFLGISCTGYEKKQTNKTDIIDSIVRPTADTAFVRKNGAALHTALSSKIHSLKDTLLRCSIIGYGMGEYENVYLIANTPEWQERFRKEVADHPLIRFHGYDGNDVCVEEGVNHLYGLHLWTEAEVRPLSTQTLSCVFSNESDTDILCSKHYSLAYEKSPGHWCYLPINTYAEDIGIIVKPGTEHRFTARLYPELFPNLPTRYRLFYEVWREWGEDAKEKIVLMEEFRMKE